MFNCSEKIVDPLEVYYQYESAMARRRPEGALDQDSFLIHWAYRAHEMVTKDGTVVLGNKIRLGNRTIFIPSHFAPSSLKEGARTLKQLAQMDVALAVTEDLADMAVRCGFIEAGSIPCEFRGENLLKKVLIAPSLKGIDFSAYLSGEYEELEAAPKPWVWPWIQEGGAIEEPLSEIERLEQSFD